VVRDTRDIGIPTSTHEMNVEYPNSASTNTNWMMNGRRAQIASENCGDILPSVSESSERSGFVGGCYISIRFLLL
jgi:hypothetical protein